MYRSMTGLGTSPEGSSIAFYDLGIESVKLKSTQVLSE